MTLSGWIEVLAISELYWVVMCERANVGVELTSGR